MRRGTLIFAFVALVVAFIFTRGLVAQPGFTDAFYHFNAAARLAHGDGLTDPYLWTYIGAPDHLPAPSHLYWMPLTSLIAAVGMALFGASYAAAQLPFTLMYAATAGVGFWLGGRIGGGRRHAWVAGLLTLWPTQRRAQWDDRELELTSTEFSLLEVLVRNAGRPVSKRELSELGLGLALARFDRNVDVHLSNLRRKLGVLKDGRSCIKTVYRRGYLFIKE